MASIKTRIETWLIKALSQQLLLVGKWLPLKQGLKRLFLEGLEK